MRSGPDPWPEEVWWALLSAAALLGWSVMMLTVGYVVCLWAWGLV